MTLKSKDVIKLTDIGERIKDSLPLFEYRIAENLIEPMRVNQIYKKVIEKYPNDYIGGSLNFYKNIEILESKKIIEKFHEEKVDNFSDYFNEKLTSVEMSTILDDNVDIVDKKDILRKENRRTDRWFQLNKNKFNNEDDGLEIKKDKTKKLNYRHLAHLDLKSNGEEEIYIPIDNPFAARENLEDGVETITVMKKIHSNENNEGMVISFIKEEKVVVPAKDKKSKTRTDREKYKKLIQKEQFGDKKYKKLKESNLNVIFKLKKIRDWLKKMLTRR